MDWKFRLLEQVATGRQLALYDRAKTIVRLNGQVGEVAGTRLRESCPKSDGLLAAMSSFRDGSGFCYDVDGQDALRSLLDRYFGNDVHPSSAEGVLAIFDVEVQKARARSREQRRRRLADALKLPRQVTVTTTIFLRNPDVVAEALDRANGTCESCNSEAPFLRVKTMEPYLEVHHRVPLASGGEDTVENAIAVCPNCHRRLHYG